MFHPSPVSVSRPLGRTGIRVLLLATLALYLASLLPLASATPIGARPALANHTPNPSSVTVAGDLQSELGCSGDWDPGCAATHLTYDANDDVWQGTWAVPNGNFEYKAALNGAWDENYGANAAPGGGNIGLTGNGSPTKFYYDHKSHWITSSKNAVIAVAPGSFQSELGCPGDWDPGCLRSWLQDPDGNGTYSFTTTAIPQGSYEGKVAINESWDENYGAGGAPGGANIGFTVPSAGATTTFSYDSATHVLTIESKSPTGPAHDNNIEWDGLRHDSRDTLYRTPGGAVEAGTRVTIRFRTFHDDVTGVGLRVFSLRTGGAQTIAMSIAAADVPCAQDELEDSTCDFWQARIPAALAAQPDNLWYRFVVTDGTDTDYYADDTAALDGGLGRTTEDVADLSWALTQSVPGFTAPAWAKNAVIYQIFPDRFRNGRKDNDPKTGDVRYDDPVVKLGWNTLPEGYCKSYAVPDAQCPNRFGGTTPREQPRGRDYMGGDLKGVDQQLDYLQSLGVTAIYFNPIFDAGSNHSYDTQDYTKVDPYFGTQKDFDNLVKHAKSMGIRVILDGVYNHMSSDSPLFDRYHHYSTVGACESASSPYRSWFVFHDTAPGGGPCVSSTGVANSARYDAWFGFDSIPVLQKSQAAVQEYFVTAPNSIAKRWITAGANGWRMDVSGDPSFPNGYWESFRSVVKAANPDVLTVSETWQKDSTLLRMIRGDRLDTTMNYRIRDAVIGFLAPQAFDPKGFADSGATALEPSAFLNRMASQREDYADAAYYSLMNLLDSHDTERLLWTLTPGAETPAAREQDATNLAAGKQRQRLASLIQFTVPGAPTVYYGDEVGVTGDDDPDDRRTYPWADLGGKPDTAMFSHYQALAALRRSVPALTAGDFRPLLADDTADVAAYGRRTSSSAAVVVVNRSSSSQAVHVPLAGYLRDGIAFTKRFPAGGGSATSAFGELVVTVPALSGVVLVANAGQDLAGPAAPASLTASAGTGQVSLDWASVSGAASYVVYRSVVTGGGYEAIGAASGTHFDDTDVTNGRRYFYVVRAVDAAGNEGAASPEAAATP
ncbi:MAG TPA: alpha-amylase family glycosyl hydrolase, partial [Candidatus Limnocylindrales bacterium]|nr:alpha-amylase family glycosyl hydrolase [Candidatus Limnocylindrales bacterium]